MIYTPRASHSLQWSNPACRWCHLVFIQSCMFLMGLIPFWYCFSNRWHTCTVCNIIVICITNVLFISVYTHQSITCDWFHYYRWLQVQCVIILSFGQLKSRMASFSLLWLEIDPISYRLISMNESRLMYCMIKSNWYRIPYISVHVHRPLKSIYLLGGQ